MGDETAAPQIAIARSEEEVWRCFLVMRELRTQLTSEAAFVTRVRELQADGWKLAYLEAEGEIRSVAGYRFGKNLHHERYMYIDDLVTRASDHGRGYGAQLFAWLEAEARLAKCSALTLDSGVQRFAAHRFYLNRGMRIASHHFVIDL